MTALKARELVNDKKAADACRRWDNAEKYMTSVMYRLVSRAAHKGHKAIVHFVTAKDADIMAVVRMLLDEGYRVHSIGRLFVVTW